MEKKGAQKGTSRCSGGLMRIITKSYFPLASINLLCFIQSVLYWLNVHNLCSNNIYTVNCPISDMPQAPVQGLQSSKWLSVSFLYQSSLRSRNLFILPQIVANLFYYYLARGFFSLLSDCSATLETLIQHTWSKVNIGIKYKSSNEIILRYFWHINVVTQFGNS